MDDSNIVRQSFVIISIKINNKKLITKSNEN